MKKNIFIISALVAIGFASCKKDRVCECVTSSSGSNLATTNSVTLVKVTKTQAKSNCISRKYEEKNGNSTYTVTETCTLK